MVGNKEEQVSSEVIRVQNGTNEINIAINPEEIPVSAIPSEIANQISALENLDKRVKEAEKLAEKAKKSSESANRKKVSIWGGRKEGIEALQEAGVDLASAVETTVKAQRLSFEMQSQLAYISKYLFLLGAQNMANNRAVVRELEKKLSGASKEELSKLAREELMSVIKQLKEQEGIQKKQEKITKVVREHDQQIALQEEMDEFLKEQIAAQDEVDKKHDEEIAAQEKMDLMLKNLIEAQNNVDKRHDEAIAAQEKVDKELSIRIDKMNKLVYLGLLLSTVAIAISIWQLLM